jgi:ribosomal protein S18 acetylase RimI-like enzyme
LKIEILRVNYSDPKQASDLGYLLNYYATDIMGGGVSLAQEIQHNVAAELAKVSHAFSILCYVNDIPAGLVNCFEGFSTFKCKPLINIHDLAVIADFRGLGISQILLVEVEKIAREKGCCKITLEVLEGNKVAQGAYIKFGFAGYELGALSGRAMFWQKNIYP